MVCGGLCVLRARPRGLDAAGWRDPRAHAPRKSGVAYGYVPRGRRRRNVPGPVRERPAGRGARGHLRERGRRARPRRGRAPASERERPPRRRGLVTELIGFSKEQQPSVIVLTVCRRCVHLGVLYCGTKTFNAFNASIGV